jgi:outer membrane receptor protein involved in Fe transport
MRKTSILLSGLDAKRNSSSCRDRRYSLSVFAHNLLDRDYVLIPSNQVVLGQYLGAPRTIGVSLGARF